MYTRYTLRDSLPKTKFKYVVFVSNIVIGKEVLDFFLWDYKYHKVEKTRVTCLAGGHMPIMIMIMHIFRVEKDQVFVLLCDLLYFPPSPWNKEKKNNTIINTETLSVYILPVAGRA